MGSFRPHSLEVFRSTISFDIAGWVLRKTEILFAKEERKLDKMKCYALFKISHYLP